MGHSLSNALLFLMLVLFGWRQELIILMTLNANGSLCANTTEAQSLIDLVLGTMETKTAGSPYSQDTYCRCNLSQHSTEGAKEPYACVVQVFKEVRK